MIVPIINLNVNHLVELLNKEINKKLKEGKSPDLLYLSIDIVETQESIGKYQKKITYQS